MVKFSIVSPRQFVEGKDPVWQLFRELPVGRELIEEHDTFEAAHLAREELFDTLRYFGRNDWGIDGLAPWLREIGVCPRCAPLMAMAKVENEAGRTYNWKAARGECMGVACGTCPECTSHSGTCAQRLSCEVIAQRKKADAPAAIRPPRIENPQTRRTAA